MAEKHSDVLNHIKSNTKEVVIAADIETDRRDQC